MDGALEAPNEGVEKLNEGVEDDVCGAPKAKLEALGWLVLVAPNPNAGVEVLGAPKVEVDVPPKMEGVELVAPKADVCVPPKMEGVVVEVDAAEKGDENIALELCCCCPNNEPPPVDGALNPKLEGVLEAPNIEGVEEDCPNKPPVCVFCAPNAGPVLKADDDEGIAVHCPPCFFV